MNTITGCGLRCEDKKGCRGLCWLNVAGGNHDIWKAIATKCNGTIEEQEMLNDMFYRRRDRKELLNKYEFSKDEKELVINNDWY